MNIYIGNLSRTVTEDALRSAFEQFGTVESVKIIIDKFTGEARGFAFVVMPNDEEARIAIEQLNGQELDGRPLRVNEALPREERPQRSPRPGGFGGQRSGGFGGPRTGGSSNRFGRNDRGGRNGGGSNWRS